MFGSEYDEAVARARLGSAYDNQLSDIAEERLEVPGRKLGKRRKPTKLTEELEADLLEGAILLPNPKSFMDTSWTPMDTSWTPMDTSWTPRISTKEQGNPKSKSKSKSKTKTKTTIRILDFSKLQGPS
jgi:hypothetical protein